MNILTYLHASHCFIRQEVKKDKLILLDVGSCFNPFQAYPAIFIPLAIDLCPADKVRMAHLEEQWSSNCMTKRM